MAQNESDNQTIDIALLKKEVDALQVAVMGSRTRWYKNPSTLLSVTALLFSFGTTFVSYVRTYSQDIQASRIELRALLQRLTALPREYTEMSKKYQGDSGTINAVGGYINQESQMLARQAAEITRRIPSKYVSATEYYAIALALQNAYNVEGAKDLFTKAIEVSTDLSDRVAALRSRAILLYNTGHAEQGRVDFQRALGIFTEFDSGYNDYTKKSMHISTELAWAMSEAGIGSMTGAMQHIANAEGYLATVMPSPGAEMLRGQIVQATAMLRGGAPATPAAALTVSTPGLLNAVPAK